MSDYGTTVSADATTLMRQAPATAFTYWTDLVHMFKERGMKLPSDEAMAILVLASAVDFHTAITASKLQEIDETLVAHNRIIQRHD